MKETIKISFDCKLLELKETLANLTIDYKNKYLNKDNQNQRNAKYNIDLIIEVIKTLENYGKRNN